MDNIKIVEEFGNSLYESYLNKAKNSTLPCHFWKDQGRCKAWIRVLSYIPYNWSADSDLILINHKFW